MRILDLTVPVRTGMVVFRGDPDVSVSRVQSLSAGNICNLSKLEAGLHSGTHIDAPLHFIEGAPGIEATPLDALIGPVTVVDATTVTGHLDAETILRLALPPDVERLIFKTPSSAFWAEPSFRDDFIAITDDGARALVARGIRLVGIDYLSIAPYADPAPTHRTLLEAGIVILEGLDLREAVPGEYQLVCLPLLVEGADGAPARAILVADGD